MEKRLISLKSDSGNTVVEATFVVTIALVLVFVLMRMGFIFYQETLLQSVANRTATDLARTYSYSKKDPVTGYIGKDNLADQGWIESAYIISGNANGKKSKNNKEKEEGVKLAENLMNNNRLLNGQNYECEVEVKASDKVLFQNEITVTIEEKYDIPIARLLGISDTQMTRTYTGSALCVDIIGANSYHNMINVVAEKIGEKSPTDKIVDIIKSFGNAGFNVIQFIGNIFGGE